MDINRLSNESISEYKVRLCSNKEKYDLSWQDIAELLNKETGANLSPDTYRKEWSYYSIGYSDGLKAGLSDDKVIKEYEQKIIELQKEKYKLQDQKREFLNILRSTARWEHIQDELLKAVEEIKNLKPIEWSKPLESNGTREAIIIFSDWHYGLKVDNIVNKFDHNIFIYRVRKLINDSIKYGKENNISKLHVLINGDMINGLIRVSSRVNSTEGAISQIMNVSEIIAECIAKYASVFPAVEVYNVLDNHSRLFPNKEEAVNDENLARIIQWYLKARLHDVPNVKINENYDNEIAIFNVCDSKVFAVHGHRDKPNEVVENLTLMLREIPDYVIVGHYHHSEELEVNGTYVIMSPSLCGCDEFSQNIRKSSVPAQKMLIFEPGQGRICTYNIRLDIV